MNKFDYLIIGNSVAAVGAVEAIRGIRDNGSIGIISDEPYHVYSRPMISDCVTGNAAPEGISYRPLDFYTKNNVTAMLGELVTELDTAGKVVTLKNGNTVEYGKLLLSTGARPVKPPIPGIDADGIHFFTTYDEATRLANDLGGVRQIVVIGAGLIGMQASEALSKAVDGIEITVVEMCDRPLALNLDAHAAGLIQSKFEEHGIAFRLSSRVNQIQKDANGRVSGVLLGDGTIVEGQIVIVATGVAPRTELAKSCGIKVNRGVEVDQYMQTSAPDVYAAGDIVEAYDLILKQNRLIPIWPNAYLEGRTAGLAMAGKPVPFKGEIAMNAAHFFGFPVTSAGLTEAPADAEELIETGADSECYRRIIIKDNKALGIISAGEAVDRSGLVVSLIKNQTDVKDFMDKLGSCSFNNAHLPSEQRVTKQLGREKL